MTARVRPNHRPGQTWLTPHEVAAELRVSPMTVYRLIKRGELTAIQVGRSFRVPERSFDSYVRDRLAEQWDATAGEP